MAPLRDTRQTLVGRCRRHVSCPLAGQAAGDAAVKPPMIGGVRLLEVGIRLCGRRPEGRDPRLRERIVAKPERGAGGDDDRGGVCALDVNPFRERLLRAALFQNPRRRQKRQAVASRQLSDQIETIVAGDLGARILLSIDPRAERERAWPVDRQSNDDHPVGMAGEHFARVAHAVDTIGDARDRGIEIQLAPVVADGAFVIEGQAQIAEALVRLEPRRRAHHLALGQRIGLARLAREQQPAHIRAEPSVPPDCRGRVGRPSRASLR